LRFSSPATLTGCARAVRGGRPPDDPASAFPSPSTRAFSMRPCQRDVFLLALAVFRRQRIHSDEARAADALGRGVPIESVARAALAAQWAVLASVSAGRRSVAPALASSIARAGEIGETDPLIRDIHRPRLTGLRRYSMSSRSRATRTTRAPSPGFRRPQRVIRQIAPSSRGVPLPVSSIALPGRTTQVFPFTFSSPSDGVHGVLRPFAGLLPLSGWTRHACFCVAGWSTPLCSSLRHFCRSGPTCRSCLRFRPDLFSSG